VDRALPVQRKEKAAASTEGLWGGGEHRQEAAGGKPPRGSSGLGTAKGAADALPVGHSTGDEHGR
jgi:hypothetical protein